MHDDFDGHLSHAAACPELEGYHANRAYETMGFYDENGKPTLTAREAGEYKERASIDVQDDLRFNRLGMEVVDDGHELSALPRKFTKERSPGESYVAWLERSLAAHLHKAPANDPENDPDAYGAP